MKTEAGRAALEKEWVKLEKKKAWEVDKVREYEDIRREAASGPKAREVHFGRVFPLCHIKNSQLAESEGKYKGRVVFEGNFTTDQDRNWAVFSEQGTSSSHLCAAKFLDAIARMPGNDGQDSDAMGAYTQTELGSATKQPYKYKLFSSINLEKPY